MYVKLWLFISFWKCIICIIIIIIIVIILYFVIISMVFILFHGVIAMYLIWTNV